VWVWIVVAGIGLTWLVEKIFEARDAAEERKRTEKEK
jgi:hypothetical protein